MGFVLQSWTYSKIASTHSPTSLQTISKDIYKKKSICIPIADSKITPHPYHGTTSNDRRAWKHKLCTSIINIVLNSNPISQKAISMSNLDSILQTEIENKPYYLKIKLLSIKTYMLS